MIYFSKRAANKRTKKSGFLPPLLLYVINIWPPRCMYINNQTNNIKKLLTPKRGYYFVLKVKVIYIQNKGIVYRKKTTTINSSYDLSGTTKADNKSFKHKHVKL